MTNMEHEDGKDNEVDAGMMLTVATDLATKPALSAEAMDYIKQTHKILEKIINDRR